MHESIQHAEDFVDAHPDAEVTMIGHSKGGAEAMANAPATNTNAIVFNSAELSYRNCKLNGFYTAKITSYVVFAEPLSVFNQSLTLGSVRFMRASPYTIAKGISTYIPKLLLFHDVLPFYSIDPVENHSMDAVIDEIKNND